jgi:thiol-disulfide isomerase/thioredoxin
MRTSIKRPAILAVAIGLCLAARHTAAFDDPKPGAYEPKARTLLEEIAKVYQGLEVYSDQGSLHGTMALAQRVGNAVQVAQTQRTQRRSLAFARPNKLRIRLDNIAVVCDGKKVTTVLFPPRRYASAPVPDKVDTQSLVKVPGPGAPVAIAFAADGALSTAVVLDLLVSADPVKSVLDGTDGLKLEADRDVKGQTRKSLYVDQTEGPDIRMLVDPETKLVHTIELVYDIKDVNTSLERDKQFQEVTLVWQAGEINTTKAADAEFRFEPPPGFEKMEATVGRETTNLPGGDEKPADKNKKADADDPTPVEKLVGKPAPDFEITALGADGTTRKVTKADLAGKVVLIDFWATWCQPCLKELPEIQKLVDMLKTVKDDVAVVALSEDADPADAPGLQALVEKTLKEKDVKLVDGPVGIVGLDLKGKVGAAFEVDSLPTLVLIDQKGMVRSVHIGYTEHASVVLGEEIVALLEGKPIPNRQAEKP